ncbi:GspE/PulE family protein [Stieleria varia]|uniref:Putative type II secretion system protein E n=1 Tax=Stieleria varia TaxID=2528005 RepID=A0A5C6B5I2_9BACT|nr:ATPase, T2SS/T4P/T4SS family [Stieleria varia]TWU05744.1 putative type II secretion system protein E [Stieleria varia]
MTSQNGIDFQEMEHLEAETELMPPELYTANLIEWALERHASDLFVSDSENSVTVSIRQMGRIRLVRRLAKDYGRRLQGHLKILASADAGDHIRPVEGRGVITTPDGSVADMRLSAVPTLFGQDVAIRLFDPVRGSRQLEQLGLDDTDRKMIESLLNHTSGMILVTGPVASGKSSTLYAMLDHLNDGTRKIHTIEDPVEHSLVGVMQSQVNLRAGLDFSDLLTVVLRHSPDVIMIGEIRDHRTAETAVRAGASGQLVLATIHSTSSAEAIDMMLQYNINRKFMASALIGVINQRLIRRLCSQCRSPIELFQPIEVSDRTVGRMTDGEKPILYRPQGCSTCHEIGFDSLCPVAEVMQVDQGLKDAIADGAAAMELERLATQRGMLTLGESAQLAVLTGKTSPLEACRSVNDPHLAELCQMIPT